LSLQQVLNAFANKANMTYQQFVKLVQTQPELRKRVALEVQKLQQRIAQQANVRMSSPSFVQEACSALAEGCIWSRLESKS
jgi:hypothetical protein